MIYHSAEGLTDWEFFQIGLYTCCGSQFKVFLKLVVMSLLESVDYLP